MSVCVAGGRAVNTQIKQYLAVLTIKMIWGCRSPSDKMHSELRSEREGTRCVKNIPAEATAHAKAQK